MGVTSNRGPFLGLPKQGDGISYINIQVTPSWPAAWGGGSWEKGSDEMPVVG